MSTKPNTDVAELFEKVTGKTEVVDEQEETVSHDAATDADEEYYDEARQDGLDDAVAEPDVD